MQTMRKLTGLLTLGLALGIPGAASAADGDACTPARLWCLAQQIDDVESVADITRDEAQGGRPERAGCARRFLYIDPPDPVPLLSMPRAFAVVTGIQHGHPKAGPGKNIPIKRLTSI